MPAFIKKYEPDFSSDYFIGKFISLTNTMIYSDDHKNLAICNGSEHKKYSDIIDTRWQGFFYLNQAYEQDGSLYLDIDMPMFTIHCKNKKLVSGKKFFHLLLCKKISAGTDYAFSIHAVNCKNCGASFNAAREKFCPHCKGEFHLPDYDWTVLQFD